MSASIKPHARLAHLAFRPSTAHGLNGASECWTRRYLPYSQAQSSGVRASWSAMFCHTDTYVSCPWSARHKAGLWRKRHTKRPGGSLFPLSTTTIVRSRSSRTGRISVARSGAYRHDHLMLRAVSWPLSNLAWRRSLPPTNAAIGRQTGRERPRVLTRRVHPAPSRGVAHVLSAGVCVTGCAACEGLVVTTATRTRHTRVTRRATQRTTEAPMYRSDLF